MMPFGRLLGTNKSLYDTGWRFPTSVSQVDESGALQGRIWSNVTRVTADDGSFTSTTLHDATNQCQTYTIQASDFGFSVPTGATIVGIELQIEIGAWPTSGSNANINVVTDASSATTDPPAFAQLSNPGAGIFTVGGASELWSKSWTPTQVNDNIFGIQFLGYDESSGLGSPFSVSVDYLKCKIYYLS